MFPVMNDYLSSAMIAKIPGVVTDVEIGEPLIGCNVIVMGTSLGASTGMDGYYFILDVPPGRYDLQISMIGYSKKILTGIMTTRWLMS